MLAIGEGLFKQVYKNALQPHAGHQKTVGGQEKERKGRFYYLNFKVTPLEEGFWNDTTILCMRENN